MKAAKVDEMKIGATDSTLDGLFRARNLVRYQIKEIEEDYEGEEPQSAYDRGWLDGLREVMDDINQEILDWPIEKNRQLSMKYPSIDADGHLRGGED